MGTKRGRNGSSKSSKKSDKKKRKSTFTAGDTKPLTKQREMKHWDVYFTLDGCGRDPAMAAVTKFTSGDQIVCLNGIPSADRDGNRTAIKYIYVKTEIDFNLGVGDLIALSYNESITIRQMLLWWRNPCGVVPTKEKIFETIGWYNNDETAPGTYLMRPEYNFTNLDYGQDFLILRDETDIIDPLITTAGIAGATDANSAIQFHVPESAHKKWFIKASPKQYFHSIYNNDKNYYDSLTEGALLYLVSVGAGAASPAEIEPKIMSRVRFLDQ